jgi:hypothetical protein
MKNTQFLFDADMQHRGNAKSIGIEDSFLDTCDNLSKGARNWMSISNVEKMNEENDREFLEQHQGENMSFSGGANQSIEQ